MLKCVSPRLEVGFCKCAVCLSFHRFRESFECFLTKNKNSCAYKLCNLGGKLKLCWEKWVCVFRFCESVSFDPETVPTVSGKQQNLWQEKGGVGFPVQCKLRETRRQGNRSATEENYQKHVWNLLMEIGFIVKFKTERIIWRNSTNSTANSRRIRKWHNYLVELNLEHSFHHTNSKRTNYMSSEFGDFLHTRMPLNLSIVNNLLH